MKSVFALFKKKQKSTENPAAIEPTTLDENARVHHSLGSSAPTLFGNSRVLFLSGVFVVALAFFSYRYYMSSAEAPQLGSIVPKGRVFPVTAAAKDPAVLARELFEEQQLSASLEAYLRALKDKPNDPKIWNDVGVIYLKNSRYSESSTYLTKSIELEPSCVECLNNLGYLKTLQGDSRHAAALFKRAIALNNDYADPYFNLAVLYEKNGDLAHSANAYREFLSRSKEPNSPFNLKLKQHIESLEK